jgi:REP element-mobilizing transposase RayT
MKYDPSKHHRRSVRLRTWDYTNSAAYFITTCTLGRQLLFGDIHDGEMILNPLGEAVADEWLISARMRSEIILDEWGVMPNHFHGIVVIDQGDQPVAPTPATSKSTLIPKSLGAMVSGFKAGSAKRVNQLRGTRGISVWQRSFYDHVIATEEELDRIRNYILTNPARWQEDTENPDRRDAPT